MLMQRMVTLPYAIDNLNQAADKEKKDPEIQILLGDAYRKMIDGANATFAYQKALDLDPKECKSRFYDWKNL